MSGIKWLQICNTNLYFKFVISLSVFSQKTCHLTFTLIGSEVRSWSYLSIKPESEAEERSCRLRRRFNAMRAGVFPSLKQNRMRQDYVNPTTSKLHPGYVHTCRVEQFKSKLLYEYILYFAEILGNTALETILNAKISRKKNLTNQP